MDWTFYVVSLGVFFVAIVLLLSIRIFVHRRLDKLEEAARKEREVQHTSETNSGL